jgi:hypothetical protein
MATTEPLMVPYPDGSGSGHAGNDTSRERQERNDASGVTSLVQRAALRMVELSGSEGVTVAEFEDLTATGHGQASSAFSHLHRAGHVRRIKMRRKRHEIYVMPEFVNGREESPYRPRLKPAKHPRDVTEQQFEEACEQAGVNLSFGEYRRLMGFLP